MNRENLCLWIAALSIAGMGWFMNLAQWCCRFDPYGIASAVVPPQLGLGVAALHLQFGCDACTFAVLTLLAVGFVEGSLED